VEIKYSSSSALLRGFKNQLPDYNKAEKSNHSIYLILRTTNSDKTIKAVESIANTAKGKGARVPHIVVIDARQKPSASKKR